MRGAHASDDQEPAMLLSSWITTTARGRRLAKVALFLAVLCSARQVSLGADGATAELQFNEALVLYEQGAYEDALLHFEELAASNPTAQKYIFLCQANTVVADSPMAVSSEPRLDGGSMDCGDAVTCASAVTQPRAWHLTVLTGYQYDSNVTLQPDFIGLGSDRDIEDSSWFEAAFGDYQLVSGADWNLGLIGSVYANQYFEANEFDIQDYMGGFYTNALLNDVSMAGFRYEFHETLLDYSQFAQQHRLTPNITVLEDGIGHTTFYYELESAEFEDTPLIPAMDRSGDTNSVGATQAIYTWGGLGRLFFGYRYDRAKTDGTDFDRRTHQVTGRIERPLGQRFVWDGEVRQFWDDYDNPNSLDFFGAAREDDRTEARTGLQYIINEHLSLRSDYTFISSYSNVANLFGVRFYDYDRHLLTTQLIYDF